MRHACLVAPVLLITVACGESRSQSSGATASTGGGQGGTTTTTTTDDVTIGSGAGTGSGGSSSGGGGACASLVDFETVPGGAPADGLSINTQFAATDGIAFGLDKDLDGKPDPGVSPVLAKVGDPATAFSYDTGGVGDTAAPGQNVGMYFLTDDGMIAGPPAPLIITYASPVSAAYGQIIDVDGTEGWTVDARDDKDTVLNSVVFNAGDPGTGDGIATPFSFKHMAADIYSIRLRYTGASAQNVGLAFDNFSPSCDTPVPK